MEQANRYLEELIDRYQNLVFSVCYKMTENYFDAEDLTQDTFLSAYKNFSRFDGQNEKAWLCKIATNKCLDYLKRAGRRSIPTEDIFFLSVAEERPSPEDICMEHEVRQKLYDCCMALKPPYRDVALDYYYHEMEIGEIVKKTGKNIKTLQTQIYRAKAMLRKLYGKEIML